MGKKKKNPKLKELFSPTLLYFGEHAAGFGSRVREHRNSDRGGGSLAGRGEIVP